MPLYDDYTEEELAQDCIASKWESFQNQVVWLWNPSFYTLPYPIQLSELLHIKHSDQCLAHAKLQ